MADAKFLSAPDVEVPAEQQAERLRSDVASVRDYLELLRRWNGAGLDQGRVLGLLSVASGAEDFLPYTIPNLLRQLAQADKAVDLVIGLNNGFTCEPILAYFQTLPDVALIRLWREPGPLREGPLMSVEPGGAPFVLSEPEPGAPRHRIIVVDRQARGDSAWKMRMLGDLVLGLLLPSLRAGWRAPSYTLLFDAETLFIAHDDDRNLTRELAQIRLLQQKIPHDVERLVNVLLNAHRAEQAPLVPPAMLDWHGRGLELLVAGLDDAPELALLGAITRFCVYSRPDMVAGLPVMLPSFDEPCSPMHTIYQYTCGAFDGCRCMPGGGTLGRTLATLSLLAVIATSHPDTICEDSMLTVLAEHAGFQLALCPDVYLTNRCPAVDEHTRDGPPEPAWQQQFARWYAGFDAVERLYGRAAAASVLGVDDKLYLSMSLALFLRTLRRMGDARQSLALLERFLSAGTAYQAIRTLARKWPAS